MITSEVSMAYSLDAWQCVQLIYSAFASTVEQTDRIQLSQSSHQITA